MFIPVLGTVQWAVKLVLACLGSRSSQYAVASAYYHGRGVSQSAAKALVWCRRSADQGYAKAQILMATFHVVEFGVRREPKEIFRWYQLAAEQNDAQGIHSLAWCYEQGIGVHPSADSAFQLWLKAARLGFAQSQYAVAECLFRGIGIGQDVIAAREWCELAIKKGAESNAAHALLHEITAKIEKREHVGPP